MKKNDTVYYELRRFLELLKGSNPNICEVLFSNENFILYKDPIMEYLFNIKNTFITKRLQNSFGQYAATQIQKARGYKKKIVNPVGKERKTPLDFCYIMNLETSGTISLNAYLKYRFMDPDKCGLTALNNARDCYMLFYNESIPYKGIINKDGTSNELRLSSIPKGEIPLANMIYNKDGYVASCKEYKEYWDWVEKRNDVRYNTNMDHAQGYDSKNISHSIRLLEMAIEIGEGKGINVLRPNAEELLKIKRGEYTYDFILNKANLLVEKMNEVYSNSNLPDEIDISTFDDVELKIRKEFYKL